MSFERMCLQLVVHDAYMAGVEPQAMAGKLKRPVGTIRKWIASVAHARTGTDLPIAKIRGIRRRSSQ